MKPILILLFLILAFWSVITSFRAIYLILTNKFNGSKSTWILISMIGFIGPILWISKGKKLIVKTNSIENWQKIAEKIFRWKTKWKTKKNHYAEFYSDGKNREKGNEFIFGLLSQSTKICVYQWNSIWNEKTKTDYGKP